MSRLSLLFCTVALSLPLPGAPLTQHDRDFVLSHLHASRKQILDLVRALTPEQLNFQPAAGRWSIAQCLEHITVTERMILDTIRNKVLTSPPRVTERPERPDLRYQKILDAAADRQQRAAAPPSLEPRQSAGDKDLLLSQFQAQRDQMLAFIRDTNAPLHDHFLAWGALGELSAYEILLYLAGHAERHYVQMKEVMASPGFPQ